MHLALCKIPDKPCVHSSEQKIPGRRIFSRTFHIIKNPRQLRRRKIRVRHKPCSLSHIIFHAVTLQPVNIVRRSPALPYNRIVNGPAGTPVPHNRRLTLVSNPQRRNIIRRSTDSADSLSNNRHLRCPYLHRVMLNPARLRVYLCELLLCHTAYPPLLIKQNASGACRSLIK